MIHVEHAAADSNLAPARVSAEPDPRDVYLEHCADADRIRIEAEREGSIIVLCVMGCVLIGCVILAVILGWRL